jgi:ABC-type transport system substrate-binding protein
MAANRAGFLPMSPASDTQWGQEHVRLHPVGTGPFQRARRDQNPIIVLEKNADYCKAGLPSRERVELRIMKEGVPRVTALRAGAVDCANAVPRAPVERLARDTHVQMLRGRETQRITLAFNQRQQPFKDVRVRQAVLGDGIDRYPIAKTALLGQAQPLWSVVPQGARDPIDFGAQVPYYPEKARTLLQEAGYDEKPPCATLA